MLAATLAHGATFIVPPGPGTPVQDAIDAASPGDTIRLSIGAYPERLLITKAIKLRGVRSTSVGADVTLVGGGDPCGTGPTIQVFAENVTLRGILVSADTLGGVRVLGNRIKMTDIFVGAHCEVVGAPFVDVEFSSQVKLTKVWAAGVPSANVPAGIRIADTAAPGRIKLVHVIAGRSQIGILLENNGILGPRIATSDVNFNVRGIVLRGTSNAVVHHNKLVDNSVSGIELEATATDNSVVRNEISGSTNDVVDAGTGNCWRNNTFGTGSVPPC